MNLFYQPAIPRGVHALDEDESWHAVKVLRMQVGDVLLLTDGAGCFYKARITNTASRTCTFEITDTIAQQPRNYRITLAVAPTKNADRMEWLVEKATEVGVEEIHFMRCQNSERKTLNTERLVKIAVSAMKQSGQCVLPAIYPIKPFAEIVALQADQKFIGYVNSTNSHLLKYAAQPAKSYLVLIGPEGDFRPDELKVALQNGFGMISLGSNRLRTETAALVACQTLNFVNL
ncbi:MAG: 16S rRNA (uracil(1498)-N(3))-methyltransferase [Cyclobacteriaceae bacterium]|nr:16S rRNA (uracil(1498)-N(3))-methyltransferase [Cyclobacteriaceae bacterium]